MNERVDCMACIAIGDVFLADGVVTIDGITHALLDGAGSWTWRRCCYNRDGTLAGPLRLIEAVPCSRKRQSQ